VSFSVTLVHMSALGEAGPSFIWYAGQLAPLLSAGAGALVGTVRFVRALIRHFWRRLWYSGSLRQPGVFTPEIPRLRL
jgi:hypothetical protein